MDLEERLRALRRDFDGSFARPRSDGAEEAEDLLAIRLGDAPFLLRLTDLSSLREYRAPTPLHGGPPGLLGLGAEGGRLFAAYDLAAVMGRPGGALRWFLVPRADAHLALAFTGVDALSRVSSSTLIEHPGEPFAAAFASGDGRPVLDLGAIVAEIHRRAA